jgi:hypothetical protein
MAGVAAAQVDAWIDSFLRGTHMYATLVYAYVPTILHMYTILVHIYLDTNYTFERCTYLYHTSVHMYVYICMCTYVCVHMYID